MKAAGYVFFALAVVLAAGAARAESVLLRGSVGKYPVVMQLDDSDGDAYGTYFYDKYKQDIELRGKREGQVYRLSSSMSDSQEKNSDRFVLTLDADGAKGTFTGPKGNTLPVQLQRVAKNSVAAPRAGIAFKRPLDDYEKLRLAGLSFVPGKQETVQGKYAIQWITEPRSKVAMFHVLSGYPQLVIERINAVIDRDFYEHLSGYFGCSDGQGGPGNDILEVADYYLDERFVSYMVNSSWYCVGTAHPDFGQIGTTIDARTGRELAQEDIYWLGKGAKPARDSDAWMKYRTTVFAPAIVQLFSKLYAQEMKASDDDNDCDYTDPGVWDFASWYMTDKGMYVGAYFPRVQRPCDNPDWSIIPYSVLKKNNPALFEH